MKRRKLAPSADLIVLLGPIVGGVVLITLMGITASFGGYWAGIAVGCVFVFVMYGWIRKTQKEMERERADAEHGRLR